MTLIRITKGTTMAVFWYALLIFLVHPVAAFAYQSREKGACRDNREEFGFSLLGHDYESMYADNFGRCFFVCSSGEKCQSATFLWETKECKLNNETKKSRPEAFVKHPAATYMTNPYRAKKGSIELVPGTSCLDILISGDAQGDGEYWIDPTASADPFTVFCDMVTDGGGWLLINRFIMRTLDFLSDEKVSSNSYKAILPEYSFNNRYLLRNGFTQLKHDMGFTQIRFYCFKKERGRVFHIMTNKNTKGANVVKFFTTSDTMPVACGSFMRLPDDNSSLAVNCDKWGFPNKDRWGHQQFRTEDRLFRKPLTWASTRLLGYDGTVAKCDDKNEELSVGDTWQVFVR